VQQLGGEAAAAPVTGPDSGLAADVAAVVQPCADARC
jgi:hypothetical protein